MAETAEEQSDVFEKLYNKFQSDTADKIIADKESHRLVESGQPRVALRQTALSCIKLSDMRLSAEYKVKMCMYIAADFFAHDEYHLALEFYQLALDRCDGIDKVFTRTKTRVDALQNIVRSNNKDIMSLKSPHVAPMVVSNVLLCLQQLRNTLEEIFELPTSKDHEDLAWQVLNCCKLIVEIAQPLIWSSCSKYVTETLLYAGVCMEAVINLCTVRHMKFRMKIYSSAFYAALAYGVTDQAAAILAHTTRQVHELKEREELDPPVPKASLKCIANCEIDIAVMKFTLDFWRDSESFSLSEKHLSDKYYSTAAADAHIDSDEMQTNESGLKYPLLTFTERCVCEASRIHVLTSGNENENYRKRSTCILRGFAELMKQYTAVDTHPTIATEEDGFEASADDEDDYDAGKADPESEASKIKKSVAPQITEENLEIIKKFSFRTVLEMTIIALFHSVEGVDVTELFDKIRSFDYERNVFCIKNDLAVDEESRNGIQLLLQFHKLMQVQIVDKGADGNDGEGADAALDNNEDNAAVSTKKRKKQAAKALKRAIQTATEVMKQRLSVTTDLVRMIESVLYSTSSYRRRAFLKKVCVELFHRCVAPHLQRVLSVLDGEKLQTKAALAATLAAEKTPEEVAERSTEIDLPELSAPLLGLVNALSLVNTEDPVLTSSLSLLAAQVQWQLEDRRGAISLLRSAIIDVDEQRAQRVDALQHMPEDARDISALQRASFITRSEHSDWFHALKRLGAHAFAGYGIFGLSSSADRGDQALAEIQADMVALYFRFELEYCIRNHVIKQAIRILMKKEDKKREAALKEAAAVGTQTLKRSAAASSTASVKPTTSATSLNQSQSMTLQQASTLVPSNDPINADELPVTSQLKSFALKNAYYRCILLLELARADGSTDRKLSYLTDAFYAIQECEGREQQLKETFAELLVMMDSSRRPPLVVARSHRYIYAAPVGTKRLKKAAYYRVFAKERGSGTEVSIHNDDIAGCERRVLVEELTNLRHSIIRIGPLRAGDLYMLASAAFTAEDKPCAMGGSPVSPSTPAIEAVNPLPTVLLWSWLSELCELFDFSSLTHEVSQRVCSRYFQPTPLPSTPWCIGKGINLFLFPEPSLCMLSVQQSSPMLLESFINTCLTYEQLMQVTHLHTDVLGGGQHVRRKPTQLSGLQSLYRTATVATIAVALKHHELTLRCAKLGYDIATDLIRFDIVHLAIYLQSPLTVLALAMQTIEKKNWCEIEHKLYSRLLCHMMRTAALNRNLTPAIGVMNNFFPELLMTEEYHSFVDSKVPASWQYPLTAAKSFNGEYLALLNTAKQCAPAELLSDFIKQMQHLFGAEGATPSEEEYEQTISAAAANDDAVTALVAKATAVGYFWSLPKPVREQQLITCGVTAKDLVEPPADKAPAERLQIEKWLTAQLPQNMSQHLELILQLTKQLAADEFLPDDFARNALNLMKRLPVCGAYVNNRLKDLDDSWMLHLITPVDDFVETFAAAAAAVGAVSGGGGKGKKGGGAVDATAPKELKGRIAEQIPERFVLCSVEEESHQLLLFAEFVHLLALNGFAGRGQETKHFPTSLSGPSTIIDPAITTPGISDATVPAAQVPIDDKCFSSPMTEGDFIRLLGASIDIMREAAAPYAAVKFGCDLWNFICSEWYDPMEFAHRFNQEQNYIHKIVHSLVMLLEYMSFAEPAESDTAGGVDDLILTSTLEQKRNVRFEGSSAREESNAMLEEVTYSTRREVRENLLLLRSLLTFMVKVLWVYGTYANDVVTFGSRIHIVMVANCPEYCKSFGDECLPLIMHAQEALVTEAEKEVANREKLLNDFVFQYEEAQRKKRKKKLRIARVEKDEEELLFEAERDVYQQQVEEAKADLQRCLLQMEGTKQQQQRYDNLFSSAIKQLDHVRKVTQHFISGMKTKYNSGASTEEGASFRYQLRQDPSAHEAMRTIIRQISQVVSFLRGNKERVLLVQALKLQGDLLLLFDCIAEAKAVWNDIVDGIFNTMDACADWRRVTAEAVNSLNAEYVPGILPTMIALGKLSRYAASGDWDAKAGYARMAAALSVIPFQESLGHPASIAGYAAYECIELSGVLHLCFDQDSFSAKDLSLSLTECIEVLLHEEQFVVSLPMIVLLEHLYACYLCDASMWLSARFMRIETLIAAHMFAPAAAMMASIESSITAIQNKCFSDVLRARFKSSTSRENAASSGDVDPLLHAYETSVMGLNFCGHAPFFGNLPLHEQESDKDSGALNMKALEWIKKLPETFEEFAQKFTVKLPVKEMTEEEKQKAAEEAAKAAEEAAAAAKKKGGKKGKGKAVDDEANETAASAGPPTAAQFPPLQVLRMRELVALFLLELSQVDLRSTRPHSKYLRGYGQEGEKMLQEIRAKLHAMITGEQAASNSSDIDFVETSKLLRTPEWLSLYGRVQLAEVQHMVHSRNYRPARASLNNFLRFLCSKPFAQSTLDGDVRGILSQQWFHARYFIIIIAERQSRLEDVITLANDGINEASTQLAGMWLRRFLLQRSTAHLKRGEIQQSEADADACLQHFHQNQLENRDLVQCLLLKVAVMREQNLYASHKTALESQERIVQLLRAACSVAESLAALAGAFSADANVTFTREASMVQEYHLISPVLHNLTELHLNEPELTLKAKFDAKRLSQRMNIHIPSLAASSERHNRAQSDEDPAEEKKSDNNHFSNQKLRLGPVDAEERYAPSEFVNIYLRESADLLECQVTLSLQLEDVRKSGLHHVPADHISCFALTNDHETSAYLQQWAMRGIQYNSLLEEQLHIGEKSLKLLRQCLYTSMRTRITALLIASKARIDQRAEFEGRADDMISTIFGPLRAALELSVKSNCTHLWSTLRAVCLQFVETLGDQNIDLSASEFNALEESGMDQGLQPAERLKMAVIYLQTAIQLGRQYALLSKQTIALCSDASFDASPAEELMNLVKNCSSSSATPDASELKRLEEEAAAAEAAAGSKGKGKGSGKGGSGGSGSTSLTEPTGRDAMFLFNSILRERELWLHPNPNEESLCEDVHQLLLQDPSYRIYQEQCALASVPDSSAAIVVPQTSVSSLWQSVEMPPGFRELIQDAQPNSLDYSGIGLYSHAAVFFLLGDSMDPSAAAVSAATSAKGGKSVKGAPPATTSDPGASNNPILTKLVLPQVDVKHLEKSLRDLKDHLVDMISKGEKIEVRSCYHRLGKLLAMFVVLCKNGIIIQDSLKRQGSEQQIDEEKKHCDYELIDGPGAEGESTDTSIRLFLTTGAVPAAGVDTAVKQSLREQCVVRISPELMTRVADSLSMEIETNGVCDNDLCRFTRFALGYN